MLSRPLPFPLDYSVTDSAQTPIGEELPPLPEFPSDSDEKIVLAFEMSLNEFVKIASTIDVGSDIAYPEDSVGIWYLWSRSIMPDDLCTLIAACINNPASATRAALNAYMASDGTRDIIAGLFPQLTKGLNPGTPPDETILIEPLGLGVNPSCDLDILWAQCLAVVKTLSQALLDLMQNIEVAANIVELGNAVISSVPILSALAETMGANGWLDLVNYFQTAWQEGFEAGYTETPGGTRDSLACDLFCRCRDDCVVNIDRIFASTLAMFGESVPDTALGSLQAAAEYISGVSLFSAESSYYATMFFATLMGKAGSAFFPALTTGTLNIVLALVADEPSNDWETLCDCPSPTTGFINVNAETITINSVSVAGIAEGVGYRYDVGDGDVISISISGQMGIRFNTSEAGIFDPSKPLARINITASGGSLNVYNRSGAIGTSLGTYDAGFVNSDNTIAFTVVIADLSA